MAYIIALLFAAFSMCGSCFATALKGVRFPDQLNVAGQTLRLNGVGVHQKSIFRVDIFVAGLYLQAPAHDEREILGSDQLKKVVMVFLHDASAEQLSDAWKDSFQDSCGNRCDELRPQFAKFTSLLTDVRRGQEVRFIFYPDRLGIETGKKKAVIEGGEFTQAFLATFIGKNAGAEDAKRGLLAEARA